MHPNHNPRQLRNFVFTLNNYSPVDIEQLLDYSCKYIVFAEEIAPTTGTPHLQGYVELEDKQSFKRLLERLPKGIHVEPRYGSQEAAIKYIKDPEGKPKPEKIYEKGEPKHPGWAEKDSDIAIARELLRTRSSIDIYTHSKIR